MARTYRSRAALNELVIAEGVALLIEEGFRGDNLTLSRVFERIERAGLPRVTKGSVLGPGRLWASQHDYQVEVEARLVELMAESVAQAPPTLDAAVTVLASADLRSTKGRRRAVRELCRVAGQVNFDITKRSRLWKLFIALWGRVSTDPEADADDRLAAAIDHATRRISEELVDTIYRPLAEVVGFRSRTQFGTTANALRLLSIAAYALNDGMILRSEFLTDSSPITLPTGPEGEQQDWSEFSIALEALVNHFLEPDPHWKPASPAR